MGFDDSGSSNYAGKLNSHQRFNLDRATAALYEAAAKGRENALNILALMGAAVEDRPVEVGGKQTTRRRVFSQHIAPIANRKQEPTIKDIYDLFELIVSWERDDRNISARSEPMSWESAGNAELYKEVKNRNIARLAEVDRPIVVDGPAADR